MKNTDNPRLYNYFNRRVPTQNYRFDVTKRNVACLFELHIL